MRAAAPQNIVASSNTYSKQTQNVETSQITINGTTLRQKLLQFVKERDGVRLPHLVKEVYCSPAADISTVMDYATVMETVNGIDQKVLSQFVTDAKNFEAALAPQKIIKYSNVISLETESGHNNYEIKVAFLTQNDERYVYTFS